MKTTVVLFGGNGYIGRELTRQWQQAEAQAEFWGVSRSGHNDLQVANVHNLALDLTDLAAVKAALPTKIDYMVDLIGRPDADASQQLAINQAPALVMQQLAEAYQVRAMGFVGGKLGPKSFVALKASIIQRLRTSELPLAVVEPTLVYGADRHDSMSRLVPLLKIGGLFNANLKPVTVATVAAQLLAKLREVGGQTD